MDASLGDAAMTLRTSFLDFLATREIISPTIPGGRSWSCGNGFISTIFPGVVAVFETFVHKSYFQLFMISIA
ncbi:unnamed protein product [Thlaspi arvense]|uniref:Uncharacterized protein n=1 Tax=Thlaspi arvense TaxID=13288 RepID=A0AAU9R814_THLAR|nr:unnamed protein product [Thlaspi arvense]